MKITAAVVRASAQPFTLEELELDEPHDDEVLVRIIATGLKIQRKPAPMSVNWRRIIPTS